MIGDIKEVEIGRIDTLDKEGKVVSSIPGKKFELTKKGCSVAMGIQGLFTLIITKARIDLGANISVEKMMQLASVALTDDVIERIKEKVVQCVSAPVITMETFEEMDYTVPLDLFAEIYDFHCGEPEDKKKVQ